MQPTINPCFTAQLFQASSWLRLTACAGIASLLLLPLCGYAEEPTGTAAPPTTSGKVSPVATAFLAELAAQADAEGKLLMGMSIITDGIIGGASPWTADQMLLQTKAALAQSNTTTSALFAPPIPTGDALFDRYAAAVDAKLQHTSMLDGGVWQSPAQFPDSELATWESEFGNDARYWELRYFNAQSNIDEIRILEGYSRPADLLIEAVRRNIAQPNTLLVLALDNTAGLDQRVMALTGLSPVPLPNTITAHPVDADIAYAQAQAEARLALLNAIVKRAPEQAWAYYVRAKFWFENGEQELGLADLRAGNTASLRDLPEPWPVYFVRQAPMAATPPGSPAVCGAIWRMASGPGETYPWWVNRMKPHLRETMLCANMSGDIAPLDDWYAFACAMGMDSPSRLDVSRVILSELTQYCEEELGDQLTTEQRQALDYVRGGRFALDLGPSFETMMNNAAAGAVLGVFGQARGMCSAAYLEQCEVAQQHLVNAEIYRQMAAVRLIEPQLPGSGSLLKPLTKEEYSNLMQAELAQQEELTPQLGSTVEEAGAPEPE